MAEITKDKPVAGNAHEDKHDKETPGSFKSSKWKNILGAATIAVGMGVLANACGNNNDSIVSLPDCNMDGGDAEAGTCADGGTGGSDSGPVNDGGTGGMDAGPMDAGPMDAGMDSGMDAGPMDAGPMDAGPMDAGMDSGMDAGSDAGGACGVATTGSFSGFISLITSRTVGGYEFQYEGVSGPDPKLTITCSGNPVQTNYVCPLSVDTIIDVATDHKRITIHPTSANSSSANLSITVVNH